MYSVAFGFSCQRNRHCRAQCNLQMEILQETKQLSNKRQHQGQLQTPGTPTFSNRKMMNVKYAYFCGNKTVK